MGTFGERLKRTRENRKITLDQVVTATKISTRMLKALEEEKFEELPGGIFNKGFVRSYARFLGIDEAQAVQDYLQASGTNHQPEPAEDAELRAIADRKEKERERQRAHARGIPWGLTAAILLLVSLSMAVWGFYSRERHAATLTNQSRVRPARVLPNAQQSPAPVAQPSLTDVSQSATASQPIVTNAAVTAAPAPDLFTISIEAKEDSWLTVTADGQQIFSDILVAPVTKSFQAQKELLVRAGNAGGLEISFNGQKLPPAGEEGEVRSFSFGPSGIQTSSPKASE